MPVAEKQFEFNFFDKLLNNKQTHFSVCIESDDFDLDRTIRGFFTCWDTWFLLGDSSHLLSGEESIYEEVLHRRRRLVEGS